VSLTATGWGKQYRSKVSKSLFRLPGGGPTLGSAGTELRDEFGVLEISY